jgi:hypothetical protein
LRYATSAVRPSHVSHVSVLLQQSRVESRIRRITTPLGRGRDASPSASLKSSNLLCQILNLKMPWKSGPKFLYIH